MSDAIETPKMTRSWCPGCQPDVDEMAELVEVSYCNEHLPDRSGIADAIVEQGGNGGYLVGNTEAGGLGNQKLCEIIHRRLYSGREERRLETLQRMIDRLDHRIADPTYRKSHWMMAERAALAWAIRILRSNPEQPLSAAVLGLRGQERRS